MAEGSAGQVGGQAVQDQVTAGGSRDDAAVVSVEGHTGDLFFVVLRTETGSISSSDSQLVGRVGFCAVRSSYFEGAMQPLGLQVPHVDAVVQTATDQKLR